MLVAIASIVYYFALSTAIQYINVPTVSLGELNSADNASDLARQQKQPNSTSEMIKPLVTD